LPKINFLVFDHTTGEIKYSNIHPFPRFRYRLPVGINVQRGHNSGDRGNGIEVCEAEKNWGADAEPVWSDGREEDGVFGGEARG
jgi:hypothetical protein